MGCILFDYPIRQSRRPCSRRAQRCLFPTRLRWGRCQSACHLCFRQSCGSFARLRVSKLQAWLESRSVAVATVCSVKNRGRTLRLKKPTWMKAKDLKNSTKAGGVPIELSRVCCRVFFNSFLLHDLIFFRA